MVVLKKYTYRGTHTAYYIIMFLLLLYCTCYYYFVLVSRIVTEDFKRFNDPFFTRAILVLLGPGMTKD